MWGVGVKRFSTHIVPISNQFLVNYFRSGSATPSGGFCAYYYNMMGQNVKSNIFSRRKILAELPGELTWSCFYFF
jgi:hypothetical protein|tara:strand:- start:141 stop:365 length:225 start_codon:yes stop_codon:yes gene_type:complete